MSAGDNYVENNYAGIVGGSHNTVNNIFYVGETIIGHAGEAVAELGKGYYNILSLELMDEYLDEVCEKLNSAMKLGRYPLKIQVTNLVSACARGVYYNGGNLDTDVEKLVNRLFSIAFLGHGSEYQARIVRVAFDYFFELYPQ